MADRALLEDIARSNLSPGLNPPQFRQAIRDLLGTIPIAATILSATEDRLFTRADASLYFEALATEAYSTVDLWTAFVQWMSYFYDDMVMKQEVSEFGLRRARLLAK